MKIKSITAKHQKTVNAFIQADRKYNLLVDSGNEISSQGDHLYNRALDMWGLLPKKEQVNLLKKYKLCYGYECITDEKI